MPLIPAPGRRRLAWSTVSGGPGIHGETPVSVKVCVVGRVNREAEGRGFCLQIKSQSLCVAAFGVPEVLVYVVQY